MTCHRISGKGIFHRKGVLREATAMAIGLQSSKPQDCEDLLNEGESKSGVYLVWPSNVGPAINVYCDMDTDGGGWTVIQRRGDYGHEKDYFFRDWRAYKEGFGNLEEDFWLGNDHIHALTNQSQYSIRFDLGDFGGNKRFAVYEEFRVDDENNAYQLHASNYSGNAGDSLSPHNNMNFTTKDRDNDVWISRNCAIIGRGAWWFHWCVDSHLNGEYRRGSWETTGIVWYTWKKMESLANTEMKIRKFSLANKKKN